jgi:HK97 gp10 family phage protein
MSAQTDRLNARLAAIPLAVREAVTPALLKSGNELAERIKALIPVESGALKDSIKVTQVTETKVTVSEGGPDAPYAQHVEYGTKHAHAEPHFWPAYRLTRSRLRRRIKRAVTQAFKTKWGAT